LPQFVITEEVYLLIQPEEHLLYTKQLHSYSKQYDYMLSVLKTDGMMATVMPHGVLFRGGEEKKIRESFIENDNLEAVLGLH
jgi:type I restriction-modification system DNA methylase subunit